ncbi:MAG TPA: hypothetical protein V6C57_12905 [Coleofasciculaceae cyanobacterium]
MTDWIESLKQAYVQRLRTHYLEQYQAYCQEQESGDRYDLGSENLIPEAAIGTLPQSVQSLWQAALDKGDSYYPKVYRLAIEGQDTYAVRVTTDGDDGWLTIFDPQGRLLASAQTYIEVVVWAETQSLLPGQPSEILRAVPGFETAQSQTLWGRPLDELEAEQPPVEQATAEQPTTRSSKTEPGKTESGKTEPIAPDNETPEITPPQTP